MPLTTLVEIVQSEWDFPTEPAKQLVSPQDIQEIIRSKRLLDPERAYAGLNSVDRNSTKVAVSTVSGQVRVTLMDLDEAHPLQYYGHSYSYFLWPDPPAVYVNGTLTTTGFIWRPFSMSLEFDPALTVANSVVYVIGHLVDMNASFARVGELLANKYLQLSNVKGDEFDGLAARTMKRVNYYNNRVVRRFRQ